MDQVSRTMGRPAGGMDYGHSGVGIDRSLHDLLPPAVAGAGLGNTAGYAHLGRSGSSNVRSHRQTCTRNIGELFAGCQHRSQSGTSGKCRTHPCLAAAYHDFRHVCGVPGHSCGPGHYHASATIMADCGGCNTGRCDVSYSQDTGYLAHTEGTDDMGWANGGNCVVCLACIDRTSPKDTASCAGEYRINSTVSNGPECFRGLCEHRGCHQADSRSSSGREHRMFPVGWCRQYGATVQNASFSQ